MNPFALSHRTKQRSPADNSEESLVLSAILETGTPTGSVVEIQRRLPSLGPARIEECIRRLVVRRKLDVLPGDRWRLLTA